MTEEQIPLTVRLRLAHAAVQCVADSVGADVLHIKGEAVADPLRWPGRRGSDVDILVRPGHVDALCTALEHAGWVHVTGFAASSSFGHAATLTHENWGYVDVHRLFPGVGLPPAEAFDGLWASSLSWTVAGRAARVPDEPTQRLVLLLHAARDHGGSRSSRDVEHVWGEASVAERAELDALAERLGAEVAVAAVTGRLEQYRDRPEHDLWAAVSSQSTRLDEWRGRWHAASTWRDKGAVLARLPLVNREHLAVKIGREPGPRDVVAEFFARPVRGVREEIHRRRTR